MNWNKLEYGSFPKNPSLFRFFHDGKLLHLFGYIERDQITKDWMFNLDEHTQCTVVSVDSILDVGSPIYYIEMDKEVEEMPE